MLADFMILLITAYSINLRHLYLMYLCFDVLRFYFLDLTQTKFNFYDFYKKHVCPWRQLESEERKAG